MHVNSIWVKRDRSSSVRMFCREIPGGSYYEWSVERHLFGGGNALTAQSFDIGTYMERVNVSFGLYYNDVVLFHAICSSGKERPN